MTLKFGISALENERQNSNYNGIVPIFTPVKVLSIVLDNTHPRFEELGAWSGLGTIEYEEVKTNLISNKPPTAKPIYNNYKKLPLINEIVYLISLPDINISTITTNTIKYYIDIVPLWNHPHHNGFPNNPNNLPESQQKTYEQSEQGNTSKITKNSTDLFLGKTFDEKENIHPLLPFEGDLINEGRWGNSIRFGSTVTNSDIKSNWSQSGNNGDPILILRNGQGIQTNEGWIPIQEDINNDDSSVYLTTTQLIPINISSNNYSSYKNKPPIEPNQYKDKQIILNSGRLLFNSTKDHILFSSNKSINLNSNDGVNIDTNTVTIQSKNIYLGSKNASEPLLLGDQTVELLDQLISNLSSFTKICSTLVSTPAGTPLAPLNVVSTQLNNVLSKLKLNLKNIKSKYNYTV